MNMPSLPINYKSPEREISSLIKTFPSISFYYKIFNVVNNANKLAKANKYPVERWVQDSLSTLQCVEECGGKIDVEGMEHFTQTEGPCVFVANHMSTLETFGLPIFIQPYKDVSYIVKSSLATYPLFGAIMRSRNPILLDRVNPREDFAKSMTEGAEMLAGGRSIIIFPQGTRKKVFDEQDFNSLGAKIAKKANVPLVPIALKTNFWDTGNIIKDFGFIKPANTVYFHFGEAMQITGNGKAEHAACVEFIKNKLESWK